MFRDRRDAGRQLAKQLLSDPFLKQVERDKLLVLSIPRGGVMVGTEVAQALGCAHEVIAVKKIGFPGHEELAIGAIAEDGLVILDERMTRGKWLSPAEIADATEQARTRLASYIQIFRGGRPLDVHDKTVIVVDDGVATGETAKAALRWLISADENHRPNQVFVAVPVSSSRATEELAGLADGFICLSAPAHFWAVGQFYLDFTPVDDAEVVRLLAADPL